MPMPWAPNMPKTKEHYVLSLGTSWSGNFGSQSPKHRGSKREGQRMKQLQLPAEEMGRTLLRNTLNRNTKPSVTIYPTWK